MGNSKDMEKMRIWESDMEVYLKKFIEERGDGEEWLKELCTNQHKNCIFWASKGECKSNPVRLLYFFVGCAFFQNIHCNLTFH